MFGGSNWSRWHFDREGKCSSTPSYHTAWSLWFLHFQEHAVFGGDPGNENLLMTAGLDDEGIVENIHALKTRNYKERSGTFARNAMQRRGYKGTRISCIPRHWLLHLCQDCQHRCSFASPFCFACPSNHPVGQLSPWLCVTGHKHNFNRGYLLRVNGKRLVLLYGDGEWALDVLQIRVRKK